LAGFQAASEVASLVELDVRRSADGELVLSHDPSIGGLVVAETGWPELRVVDVGHGHHPIRLDDLMEQVPELALDIEIKNWPLQPGFEPDGETALRVAGMARASDFLSCFYWVTMDQVKARFPSVRTCLLVDEGGSFADAIAHARAMGHEIVAPHWSLVGGPVPDDLLISVWTMNDPGLVVSLAEWGVDAIITDDPGLIAGALERIGGGDDVNRTSVE
jgi:glycerophosphoryl diester phosphodiesterase